MLANILTIGTEITTGEIVNSNAAWIARQLESHGYDVNAVLSIRDEKSDILDALKNSSDVDVLVITGGLGPTSDDLTREMVAKWLGKSLVFNDKVWKELQKIYKKRQLPVRESHRHQCYFPKSTQILKNPVGTAHGFSGSKGDCLFFVLPGPPRELQGMWKTVEATLRPGGALTWKHWTVLGMPESELAEIVEPLIRKADLEVGYRASIPYVHLKLRGRKLSSDIEKRVDQALKTALVSKETADFAVEFFKSLGSAEILIQDQVTRGLLTARLSPILQSLTKLNLRMEECWNDQPFQTTTEGICGQILRVPKDEFSIDLKWRDHKKLQKTRFKLPYKLSTLSERGAKSAAEWALFKWWQWSRLD